MHSPTHIVAGLVIGRSFKWKQYRFFAALFTVLFALFAHAFMDSIAKYPTAYPSLNFSEPVWLLVHVISLLGSIVLLYVYWTEYCLGILCSILPDIEWLLLSVVDACGKEITLYKKPFIHLGMIQIIEAIPLFTFLHEMPPYLNYAIAAFSELAVFIGLYILFKMVINRRRNVNFK